MGAWKKIAALAVSALLLATAGLFLTGCGEKFDLIFLDPPYGSGMMEKALSAIAKIDIVTEHGIIVCESAADSALPELPAPYERGRDYRYGKIKITLYHRGTAAQRM